MQSTDRGSAAVSLEQHSGIMHKCIVQTPHVPNGRWVVQATFSVSLCISHAAECYLLRCISSCVSNPKQASICRRHSTHESMCHAQMWSAAHTPAPPSHLAAVCSDVRIHALKSVQYLQCRERMGHHTHSHTAHLTHVIQGPHSNRQLIPSPLSSLCMSRCPSIQCTSACSPSGSPCATNTLHACATQSASNSKQGKLPCRGAVAWCK